MARTKNIYFVALTLLAINAIICSGSPFKVPPPPTNLRRPRPVITSDSELPVVWRSVSVSPEEEINSIESVLSEKSLKYPIDTNFRGLSYENLPRRLERFYKHSSSSSSEPISFQQQYKKDSIVFPDQEEIVEDKIVDNENGESSQTSDDYEYNFDAVPRTNSHSLENLAQIVRQLLFRNPTTEEATLLASDLLPQSATSIATEPDSNSDSGSDTPITTEFTISEHSLYSGPQIKNPTNDDGDCPHGFKKTRNGSCQKPSRRLASG